MGQVPAVTWQGPPDQPSARQQLTITLVLEAAATPASTQYSFSRVTDASGFFTVPVGGLVGTYNWWVKGPDGQSSVATSFAGYLATTGSVTLVDSGVVQQEMGLQRAGDAVTTPGPTNFNVVNATDFTVVKAAFGKLAGQPGYDGRVDWDNNQAITSVDFTLLKGNFGQAGAPPLGPAGMQSIQGMQATAGTVRTSSTGGSDSTEAAHGTHAANVGVGHNTNAQQDRSSSARSASSESGRGPVGTGASRVVQAGGVASASGNPARSPASRSGAPLDPTATPTPTANPTHSPTHSTIYIGSLYEEDVTNGSTTASPYISYYSLGGKMVGMRRANQADASSNGQFGIAGDHLGSTTLIVDATSASHVVQRAYYKPYGETAWSYAASSSLTSVGYTGQRLDGENGLLYYRARYYDPGLSYFLSADNIAPNPVDPKSRNRYAYTLNNPLKYDDPTGHCVHNTGVNTEQESQRCDAVEAKFKKYGIELEGDWQLWELERVLGAVEKLMEVAQWNPDAFKQAMGITDGGRLIFSRRPQPPLLAQWFGGTPANNPAYTYKDDDRRAIVIEFHDAIFNGTDLSTKGNVVHELGHAWSYASRGRMDRDFRAAVGYDSDVVCGPGGVCGTSMPRPTGKEIPIRQYGYTNSDEDFADSVSAAVYPEAFDKADQAGIKQAKLRLGFVRNEFRKARR